MLSFMVQNHENPGDRKSHSWAPLSSSDTAAHLRYKSGAPLNSYAIGNTHSYLLIYPLCSLIKHEYMLCFPVFDTPLMPPPPIFYPAFFTIHVFKSHCYLFPPYFLITTGIDRFSITYVWHLFRFEIDRSRDTLLLFQEDTTKPAASLSMADLPTNTILEVFFPFFSSPFPSTFYSFLPLSLSVGLFFPRTPFLRCSSHSFFLLPSFIFVILSKVDLPINTILEEFFPLFFPLPFFYLCHPQQGWSSH